jgi:hypothetical protein
LPSTWVPALTSSMASTWVPTRVSSLTAMLLRKRKRSEHQHHYPQPDPTFHINLPGNNLTDRWMRLCWTGQERRIRVSRNSFIVRKKKIRRGSQP